MDGFRLCAGGVPRAQAEPASLGPAAPERPHRSAKPGLSQRCPGDHQWCRRRGGGPAQRLLQAQRAPVSCHRDTGAGGAVTQPQALTGRPKKRAGYNRNRGVEQRQLVGLITRRSLVRIQAPQLSPSTGAESARLQFAFGRRPEQKEASRAGQAPAQEAKAQGASSSLAVGCQAPGAAGAVAQVVERATHNRVVAGSSPAGTTMPSTRRSGALAAALSQSALIQPGERVLVAFSGGPDSTALLLGLREAGHDVVAAHFDHALQPGSEMVAAHASRVCASLGITLMAERRTSPVPKGSVQAAARSLRYDFLERCAGEAGASRIALGHTADDLVEGTVMHLLRGCGIAGLRGMPATRGRFVRPLLGVWRAEVLAFLDERGVVALEDPANSNLRYRRVSVRRELLPALER